MSWLTTIIFGIFFGIATVIPGFSGATIAVILGFYEQLINAVSSIFSDFKKNFKFLLYFVIGVGVGVIVFAFLVKKLIDVSEICVCFAFLGIVVGTAPSVYKKSGLSVKRAKPTEWLAFLIAGGIMILLSCLNVSGSIALTKSSFIGIVNLFWVGIVASLGPVVPGISGSLLLVVLTGITGYQAIMTAVSSLDVLTLLPFGLGVLVGILALSKLIKLCFARFNGVTNAFTFGLVVFSVVPLYRPLSANGESFLAVAIAIVFAVGSFFLIRLAERKTNAPKADADENVAKTQSDE